MHLRFIEISEDNRHLSLERGFMVVSEDKKEIGKVALDDIAAVISTSYRVTFSNNLMIEFCERGIPFVLCASNHSPAGFLLPLVGHHKQTGNFQNQMAASVPQVKQLWKSVVTAKIKSQQEVLKKFHIEESSAFDYLISKIRSGDPDNIEAQAARKYWQLLFGKDFRRDTDAGGINCLLNYGYAVLRATVARYIVASGLHPSLGIHHKNKLNPMCLADDLMEPFRPFVDYFVKKLILDDIAPEMTKETKKYLVELMYKDIVTLDGTTPLIVVIQKLCVSLVRCYQDKSQSLYIPDKLLSLVN